MKCIGLELVEGYHTRLSGWLYYSHHDLPSSLAYFLTGVFVCVCVLFSVEMPHISFLFLSSSLSLVHMLCIRSLITGPNPSKDRVGSSHPEQKGQVVLLLV